MHSVLDSPPGHSFGQVWSCELCVSLLVTQKSVLQTVRKRLDHAVIDIAMQISSCSKDTLLHRQFRQSLLYTAVVSDYMHISVVLQRLLEVARHRL